MKTVGDSLLHLLASELPATSSVPYIISSGCNAKVFSVSMAKMLFIKEMIKAIDLCMIFNCYD